MSNYISDIYKLKIKIKETEDVYERIIILFLIICTSFSYASNVSERKNLNIVINSEKIYFNLPILSYNDYTLVPLKSISPYFNIEKNSITYSNKTIILKRYNSTLKLFINNINGNINGNNIKLPIAPIIYKNNVYVPIRVISDFYDCYTHYDSLSKTIFIKDLNEFQQVESFFNTIQDKLKFVNTLQIDIINELKNDTSTYSFGNSIYIDKNNNSVFQKNMLESNWKEIKSKLNYTTNNFSSVFNTNFFVGLSFDRKKSSETQMIFYGFYPTSEGRLCKTTFCVDTYSLHITEQIAEYFIDDLQITQCTLYSYT